MTGAPRRKLVRIRSQLGAWVGGLCQAAGRGAGVASAFRFGNDRTYMLAPFCRAHLYPRYIEESIVYTSVGSCLLLVAVW